MLELTIKHYNNLPEITSENIELDSLEDKVKLLIIRDLLRLNWQVMFEKDKISISPPEVYEKKVIKKMMAIKKNEIIKKNIKWIRNNIDLARSNIADGKDILGSEIYPEIEVCNSSEQHSLFRILRFYWSSPYSDYVGRRLKFIIRDAALPQKPVIGIIALGSPIIHIPERDDWIGWDIKTRSENIIYTMDAYVLGAIPPYNYLLGGKLLSYILASNEIREIYSKKYRNQITLIKKRKANDLVAIFVTSLYGRSSQYNRIKFKSNLLFQHIGATKGYGSLHLSDETFDAMRMLLDDRGILVTNKFGDGPNWKMRLIRTIGDVLGFDSDFLLKHSFRRWIYLVPLADNFKDFLQGKTKNINYKNYPLSELINFWRNRWFNMRKYNTNVIEQVTSWKKNYFLNEIL